MYGSIGPSDTSCVVGKHGVASSTRGHYSLHTTGKTKLQENSRKLFESLPKTEKLAKQEKNYVKTWFR